MKKDNLNIVMVGHVDHGKSTLIGRLLLDTGSLPKEKLAEVKKISHELGKDAELAYVTDQLKEEREQNITIDTTQIFFSSRKRDYVIIDAPGHVEFLKNMITGASQATAAVLIIDTNEGIQEQTRRHAYLIGLLGISHVIVVCNKMDCVSYDQNRFITVKSAIEDVFQQLGLLSLCIIPLSAREGGNIIKKDPHLPWYKGPLFLEALDAVPRKSREEERPLRFAVQDIYHRNEEKIIAGKVISGNIKVGQEVTFFPDMKKVIISKIKFFGRNNITTASTGESIGIVLSSDESISRGDMLVEENNQELLTKEFTADLFWMNSVPLKTGEPVTLRCSTQEIEAEATNVIKRINSSTLEILGENEKELTINEAGIVCFKARVPVLLEKFNYLPELGRFIIEKDNELLGAGIIP